MGWAGNGAPYALVAAGGLQFAPAYDQGALNPGCMPLFVGLIAHAVLRKRFPTIRKIGLALILAGAATIIAANRSGQAWDISRVGGDALFLLASFLTACFTVQMRQAKLEPLHATALVATGSLVIYLPVYLVLGRVGLGRMTFSELAFQTLFQGVLVTIVALLLYGRAVAILGASRAAAFGALVPALSALLAMPLPGERPTPAGWFAIVLISVGVYLASRSDRAPFRRCHVPDTVA
jgi:drug/metabolite transporter (DMT)-like permease